MKLSKSKLSLPFIPNGNVEHIDFKYVESDHAKPDALEDEGPVGSILAENLVVQGDVKEVVCEVEGILLGGKGEIRSRRVMKKHPFFPVILQNVLFVSEY